MAITQGAWGERIAANIAAHAPTDWEVQAWAAPRLLPPIIDDPDDFLPQSLSPSDLILALGETPGLAQLIPDAARRAGARSVIAPIDHSDSLPAGLAAQLEGWLGAIDVAVVFPRPFCSLTDTTYNRTSRPQKYDDPLIRRFASRFGRPRFSVAVANGTIQAVDVLRDAACGCARHVADSLPGTPVDDAVDRTGLLHHHFPCLASMNQEPDYHDTLMHVSGNALRDAIQEEIREHLTPAAYLRPHGLTNDAA